MTKGQHTQPTEADLSQGVVARQKPRLGRFIPNAPEETRDVLILRPLMMCKHIYTSQEEGRKVGFRPSRPITWRKAKGSELTKYEPSNAAIQPDADYYFAMPKYTGVATNANVRADITMTAIEFFERCGVKLQVIDRLLINQSHNLVFVLPAVALEDEATRAAIRLQYKQLYDAALAQKHGAAR
jgi:hypothetical protein